jgi:hypothetical protein
MRNDIIAKRTLDYRDGETTRPVTVRVHRPEELGSGDARHWACRIEWDGLDVPARETIGVDSAEALFNALDMVGDEVKRHDGLRHRNDAADSSQRRNPWPIERGPASFPVPAPLPGDVIAERMLAPPGSKERTVRVAVHRPQPKGADEWICWYEIQAPGQPDRRSRAVGTDSAQALFHALARAKWDIEARDLGFNGDNPWAITIEAPEEPTNA